MSTATLTLSLPATEAEALAAIDGLDRDILAALVADPDISTPTYRVDIPVTLERTQATRAGSKVPTFRARTGVSKSRGLRGATFSVGGKSFPLNVGSKSTGTVRIVGGDWHGVVKIREADAGWMLDADFFEGPAGTRGRSSDRTFH